MTVQRLFRSDIPGSRSTGFLSTGSALKGASDMAQRRFSGFHLGPGEPGLFPQLIPFRNLCDPYWSVTLVVGVGVTVAVLTTRLNRVLITGLPSPARSTA